MVISASKDTTLKVSLFLSVLELRSREEEVES